MAQRVSNDPVRIVARGTGVGPFLLSDPAYGETHSCYRVPEKAGSLVVQEAVDAALGVSVHSLCQCLGVRRIQGVDYVCERRPGPSLAEIVESQGWPDYAEEELAWILHSLLTGLLAIHHQAGAAHGNVSPHAVFVSSRSPSRVRVGGAFFWRRLLDAERPAKSVPSASIEQDIEEAIRMVQGLEAKDWTAKAPDNPVGRSSPTTLRWGKAVGLLRRNLGEGMGELGRMARMPDLPASPAPLGRLEAGLAKHRVSAFRPAHRRPGLWLSNHWIDDGTQEAETERTVARQQGEVDAEKHRLAGLKAELKEMEDRLAEREAEVERARTSHQQQWDEIETRDRMLKRGETELAEKAKTLQMERSRLDHRTTELEAGEKRLKQDLARSTQEHEALERTHQELAAERARLVKQVDDLTRRTDGLTRERDDVKQRLLEVEGAGRGSSREWTREKTELEAKIERLEKKARDEASIWRQKNDELASRLQTAVQASGRMGAEERSKLELELQGLRQAVEISERRADAAVRQLEDARAGDAERAASDRDRVNTLETELRESRATLDGLKESSARQLRELETQLAGQLRGPGADEAAWREKTTALEKKLRHAQDDLAAAKHKIQGLESKATPRGIDRPVIQPTVPRERWTTFTYVFCVASVALALVTAILGMQVWRLQRIQANMPPPVSTGTLVMVAKTQTEVRLPGIAPSMTPHLFSNLPTGTITVTLRTQNRPDREVPIALPAGKVIWFDCDSLTAKPIP